MSGLFTSLAVMMSPGGLAAAGEGTGLGGAAFMAVLVISALASFFTARGMESLGSGKVRATGFDSFVFGLLDSARLFTITVLAVSWLGVAGDAVSGIFLPWLPHLGASFLILGLAALCCLIADENGADVFGICLTLGICTFVYVAVMSVQPADSGAGYPTVIPPVFPLSLPDGLSSAGGLGWLQLVFLAVFVFLGFDLPQAFENRSGRAVPAILLALLFFLVFSWTAQLLTGPAELSESPVPYMLVAELGLGELGRYLMGAAVILLTLAALLGFFRLVGKRMETVLVEEYRPHAPKAAAVVVSVLVGFMLGSGWVAADAFKSFVSAGLCFWFGTYALTDLLYLIGVRRAGGGKMHLLFGLVVLALHVAAGAFCVLHIEFPVHFYYSLAGMGVAGIVFGVDYYMNNRPEPAEISEPEYGEEENGQDLENAVPEADDEALKIVDYS